MLAAARHLGYHGKRKLQRIAAFLEISFRLAAAGQRSRYRHFTARAQPYGHYAADGRAARAATQRPQQIAFGAVMLMSIYGQARRAACRAGARSAHITRPR